MIRSLIEGKWYEFGELHKALGLDMKEQAVVSLVGGGGKTTTMCRLQKEYECYNVPSIITTTTHIQRLDDAWFLGEPSIDKLRQLIAQYGKVWAGEVTPKGKLQSLPDEFLQEMVSEGHTMFIEADGARRLPCKAPGPCEPVFVPKTNVVLVLYGIDSIGKKIKETCFRPELVAKILEKKEEETLTPHDIAVLAASRSGGRKAVADGVDYQVILNKADSKMKQEMAMKIAEELWTMGVKKVHVTSKLMNLEEIKFGKLNV